jgi:Fic family protein
VATTTRMYQTTHPWLTFELELRRVPWDFCLLTGQLIAHIEQLHGVALPPEPAKRLAGLYAVKGAHASAAMEGNTLTEAEVYQRMMGELKLPPSKEYLGLEIDNVVAAAQGVQAAFADGTLAPLTPQRLMDINRQLLKGLHFEEEVIPGRLRGYSIGIADYHGAPAEDIPELLDRLCAWINRPWFRQVESLRGIDVRWMEAILKAVLAHAYLMWIVPFDAGNGPTARLVEFQILIGAGVPYPAAHLLAKHYHETRADFDRHLRDAADLGGDVIRFCLYAVRGFADQLREQLRVLRAEQMRLFWQTHVRAVLGDTDPGRRRRHLVVDLAKHARALDKYDLPEVSARVAKTYATLNEKTFNRDLEALADAGLIERNDDGQYRARVEVVAAYRQMRAKATAAANAPRVRRAQADAPAD